MANGAPALIAWLFALSTAMVVTFAAVVAFFGLAPAGDDGAPASLLSALWLTPMRASTPAPSPATPAAAPTSP